MPIYKIVIATLLQPTLSNPDKTIVDAILDGSISSADMMAINTITAFPANIFNCQHLPEGAYSSKQAMMIFAKTIAPFLSDKLLYQTTHKFIQAEIAAAGNNMFSGCSLAKCFLFHELERHACNTPVGLLPAAALSHMHDLMLPILVSHPTGNLREHIDNFAVYNIKADMIDHHEARKYLMVMDYYTAITNFDQTIFAPEQLSDESPLHPASHPAYLHGLQTTYKSLQQTYRKTHGSAMFNNSFNNSFNSSIDDQDDPEITTRKPDAKYNQCQLI